jgi:putative endonuclease
MPHLYLLRCADGSFYVGSTRDLERRIAQHARGEGAEYTRRRLPVRLVFAHEFERISAGGGGDGIKPAVDLVYMSRID